MTNGTVGDFTAKELSVLAPGTSWAFVLMLLELQQPLVSVICLATLLPFYNFSSSTELKDT